MSAQFRLRSALSPRFWLVLAVALLCLAPSAAQEPLSVSFERVTTNSAVVVLSGTDVGIITYFSMRYSPCHGRWSGRWHAGVDCSDYISMAGRYHRPTLQLLLTGLQPGTTYTFTYDLRRGNTDLGEVSGTFTTQGAELNVTSRISGSGSSRRVTFTFHDMPGGTRGSIVSFSPRPPLYAGSRHVYITNNHRGRDYFVPLNKFAPSTAYTVTIRAYSDRAGDTVHGTVLGTTTLTFTTPATVNAPPPPDPPPSLFMGVGVSSDAITVNWNDVGATQYTVTLIGGSESQGVHLTNGETYHTFSDLQPATSYTISVTAFLPDGRQVQAQQTVYTAAELSESNQQPQPQDQQDPPPPSNTPVPPQPQQQQSDQQQQDSDPPPPSSTPVPPPSNTPVPPPSNTPVPPTPIPPTPVPTNTLPPPPPPEPEQPSDKREKLKLSISDIGRDSLTVSWNDVGGALYSLQLLDVETGLYTLTGGRDGQHTFSGLRAGSEYAIELEVYSGDDPFDSDAKTARTAD